ncbi:MAG: hypothetical protein Q9178_002718 [Gyalolechia marmorata]
MSWSGVVENYSKRKLTYEKDKLAAIYGIADAVQKAKADVYLAGLWKSWLLYDLLWGVDWKNGATGRLSTSVAPSWSWASVSGPISTFWSRNTLQNLRLDPLAKLASVEIEGSISTQTGTLVMEGYLRSAMASNDPDFSRLEVQADRLDASGEGAYRLYDSKSLPLDANIIADEEIRSGSEITFLAIVRMSRGDVPAIVCLALLLDGSGGQFRRLGLGIWAEYSWYGKRRPCDVELGLKLMASRRLTKATRRSPIFGKMQERRNEQRIANAGWTPRVPTVSKANIISGGLQKQMITIV